MWGTKLLQLKEVSGWIPPHPPSFVSQLAPNMANIDIPLPTEEIVAGAGILVSKPSEQPVSIVLFKIS